MVDLVQVQVHYEPNDELVKWNHFDKQTKFFHGQPIIYCLSSKKTNDRQDKQEFVKQMCRTVDMKKHNLIMGHTHTHNRHNSSDMSRGCVVRKDRLTETE